MTTPALPYSTVWDRLLIFRPAFPLVAATATILTLLVGKIDVDTGTTVSLSLLYLIPIAISAWLGTKALGIMTAVFAAIVWHLAENGMTGAGLTPLLNLTVRLATFASFAWLLSEVRALNLQLKYGLDRKTASLEHEQSERLRLQQQFETFFALCDDVFCICDFSVQIQAANRAWNQLLEQPELAGRKLLEFLHPDDLGQVSLALQEVREQGGSARFKARVVRGDGSTKTLEWAVTASKENRRLFIAAHDMTNRLKLEREILEVSDLECQRIGQDLHDGLCQRLKGLGMIAEATRAATSAEVSFYKAKADKLATELHRAIQEARNIARGLYPVHLDSGLRSALEELASCTSDLFSVECVATIDESGPPLANTTAVHLYRIAQEAVSNATRHGKAKCVMIAFIQSQLQIKLSIRDDGAGFDPKSVARGMGIHSMEYRASILDAALEIHSEANEGTTILCILQRR